MKKIIISGASSGIGKAIAQNLLDEGHIVIGLNRRKGISHKNYIHYSIDLSLIDKLEAKLKVIAKAHSDCDAIIFSSGVGLFGQLEQLGVTQMHRLMNINFMSQVMIAKEFLPKFKYRGSGDLIFIGSESGLQGQTQGSIYCASKFALRGFCQSLRKECSKSGIRSCIIEPGMCRTPFFDTLDFKPSPANNNAIDPETIARTINLILSLPENTVIDEITLSPLNKCITKSSAKQNSKKNLVKINESCSI